MNTLEQLHTLKPHFSAMNIRRLRVFGSVVRGEETEASDVDLIVDFEKPIGLFAYCNIQRRLGELLGRRVDLVTEDALHPALRHKVLSEAKDV